MATDRDAWFPASTHRWPFAHPEDRRWLAEGCCSFALALSELVPDAVPVGLGRSRVFPQHVALRLGPLFLDARGVLVEPDFREIAPDVGFRTFEMDRDELLGLAGIASLPPKKRRTALGPAGRAAERWHGWACRAVDFANPILVRFREESVGHDLHR